MPNQEEDIDKLEREFPAMAAPAFAAARKRALAAGLSVLHSADGFIYEVFPNGTRRVVKQIEPPVKVIPGTKVVIP